MVFKIDPLQRWDDWEWEKAAQDIGRKYNYHYADLRDRRKDENYYYFSERKEPGLIGKWSGSQKRVLLSALLFLTLVFSSKGEDFLSSKVYSVYRSGMEQGSLYPVLNTMAKEALGFSTSDSIAVNVPIEGLFYPPVGGAVKVGFLGKGLAGEVSKGIEIESALGTPVFSPREGVIMEVYEDEKMGKVIKINFSDGWEGVLGNLGEINVKKGDPVAKGAELGTVGLSSQRKKPWLYLELRHDGRAVNPLNYLIKE
ncbi:MAG: murein hydrolase activator EnvC family protein [Desulfitobacteriia bacterium]